MTLKTNIIYNESCITGMAKLPSNSVDLVIGDPPYGLDLDDNFEKQYSRPKDSIVGPYIEVPSGKPYQKFSRDWIRESYRVLKETGSIYIISGDKQLEFVLQAVREAGFHVVRHIIWHYQFGPYNKNYISSHAIIIFAVKNIKKYKFNMYSRFSADKKNVHGKSANYKDRESVWYITKEHWRKNILKTPTKLPLELVKKILSYSTDELDVAVIPFSGSGQCEIACNQENIKWISYELSKKTYQFGKKRIESGDYFIPISKASS